MSENNETTMVDDHRSMLLMSGSISDFQISNIKAWPLVLFENVSVKIEYDFTSKEDEGICAGWVSYDFDFSKEPDLKPSEIGGRLAQLVIWTKFLFWKDTEVILKKKGIEWEI